MPLVELLYDDDCPNVELARSNIREAFALAELVPNWLERRIGDTSAAHARGYGSPTVLIDGLDAAGMEVGTEACCRLYETAGRMTKAPSAALIAEALLRSSAAGTRP